VPVSNFAGWMFTTLIIFGAFATWLARQAKQPGISNRYPPGRLYWQQAIVLYTVVALGGIFRNAAGRAVAITLANGDTWQSADIYASMTLTTVFTMIFCAVLAAIRTIDIPIRWRGPQKLNHPL
jgi:putative membrane protein